ncbi:MAG TPA: two-component sensor histidine kinase, partial [Lachnospiraceae bacterium]|nr:two-component sensor histidine kinase [Lachnospiraceae bacterium]
MFGTGKIVSRLDEMLTNAMNGTFTESRYDETELSRLESKFRQYLTGRELAGERVERERTAIKELVTNISHQTKTPLANICLYTQLLEEISDENTLPYVQQIRLQAEKLDFLIRTLTKISRLESDMIRLRPKSQPVFPLVEQAVREARGQAEAKAVTLQAADEDIASDRSAGMDSAENMHPATASYDARWTKEALGNLLDN